MNQSMHLMVDYPDNGTVAFYNGRAIDRGTFLSHVAVIRQILPEHKYSINLCENRYHFLVAFTACVSIRQVSLLPNSRVERDIECLRESYDDSYLINDDLVSTVCQSDINPMQTDFSLQVAKDQQVAFVFTSGTTGKPRPSVKTWGQLVETATRVKERFNLNASRQHSVIATVPPQHMFGFETSIVYPLILGIAIHNDRPFYPLDIQKALSEMPAPRVLITTPLHLKTCLSSSEGWPEVDFIISATAPMPLKTATDAENILNTKVFEIYGCSEAGAIATRQMSVNTAWQLLPDFELVSSSTETLLNTPASKEPVLLPDSVAVYDQVFFDLVSRNDDMVNIGGKRGSIQDLTYKFKQIAGVLDAVLLMGDEQDGKRSRLTAFVVAPGLEEKELRQKLARTIDSVFLPRPLIIVPQLPYNEMGKIPRASLLKLLDQHLYNFSNQQVL
jgi:acyl-coenzyme A synthetase/AMP-(fatty) acid ligase